MEINFNEVSVKATRRWVDADGRKRQETRKFWQTLNPFNRAADGSIKSREQILAELKAQRDAWLTANVEVTGLERPAAKGPVDCRVGGRQL